MYELDIESFTRMVVRLVETLGNATLENPDYSENFPIAVISNPMQRIRKVENNTPIYSRFAITIDWWTDSKYKSMELYQKTNILLRQNNFTTIGTPIDIYDDLTKKYRYGSTYEVNYNGLTNSFERIL